MTGSLPLREVLDEHIGPHGTISRITKFSGELAEPRVAMDLLEARGCGAYRGREQCKGPTTGEVYLGQLQLLFMTYVSITVPQWAPTSTVAFVCAEHRPPADLMKDMPRALRRDQERQCRKLKAMMEEG
tara:strand:+ start:49 stop:435 length:387 start_codon:yes stop_codon:yes gene_type:complete